MDDTIGTLRTRLAEIRDAALDVFRRAEEIYAESVHPDEPRARYKLYPSVWSVLPAEMQERADNLRSELRPLIVRVSGALKRAPLIGDADLRDLARHSKTMTAALRFNRFSQWGVQIHHDEGAVLGVDPPGQEERELDVASEAKALFVDSYRAVAEMMDYWAPQATDATTLLGASQSELRAYQPNTAFLMMWLNPEMPELNDVRDTVEEVFRKFNITATRADEIEHEGVITERIIQEIARSEFLFADLSGERPSVYYEVGYAHALGKRVVLFRKKGTKIHFDLVAYNCPEYDSLGDLRKKLTKRLQALTNKAERLNSAVEV